MDFLEEELIRDDRIEYGCNPVPAAIAARPFDQFPFLFRVAIATAVTIKPLPEITVLGRNQRGQRLLCQIPRNSLLNA